MNTSPSSDTRARQLRFAPLALALVAFFLPFVEFSCQGKVIQSMKGVELAVGKTIEQRDPYGNVKERRVDGRRPFMIALGCAAVAAITCFVATPGGKLISAGVAAGGFAALLVGKSDLEREIARESSGLAQCLWGYGFMAACALLLVGAAVAGFQYYQSTRPSSSG